MPAPLANTNFAKKHSLNDGCFLMSIFCVAMVVMSWLGQINHLLSTYSSTIFAKKPKKPIPNATKIQKVPALPALDFLAMSHIIKNKKPINKGSNPYNPILVIISDETARIIVVLGIKNGHYNKKTLILVWQKISNIMARFIYFL